MGLAGLPGSGNSAIPTLAPRRASSSACVEVAVYTRLQALGDYLAIPVGKEAIQHDAIEAGDAGHELRCCVHYEQAW